jgi:hypothetical protein
MCDCTSCSYTDGFAAKGFAEWPRGNPAGRKSAADYAAHVRHGRQWGKVDYKGRKRGEPEFPDGVPITPLRYRTPTQLNPGLDRKYPEHPNSLQGWSGTADYVEAFIAVNNYVTPEKLAKRAAESARYKAQERAALEREKASPTYAKPARPATPAKAPQHFPAPDRERETAKIYAMPKSKPAKRSRGRPALPGRFVVVKLEERLITKAEKLGGKVAAGIREALERAKVG